MKSFVKMLFNRARDRIRLPSKRVTLVVSVVVLVMILSLEALSATTFVITDGVESSVIKSREDSVDAAVEAAGISLTPDDEVTWTRSGSRVLVQVRRAVSVVIFSGNRSRVLSTSAQTVEEALGEVGIFPDEDDILSCSPDTPLSAGMTIEYTQVDTRTVTETEVIPCETVYQEDDSLFQGKTLKFCEGSPGIKSISYSCTYHNGEEVSRQEISEEVTLQPVSAVTTVGTRETPMTLPQMEYEFKNNMGIHVLSDYATYSPSVDDGKTVTSFTGEKYEYESKTYCDATAYTYMRDGVNYTASGRLAGVGVIAADWSVFPNGTIVYIVGADGSWEYGRAVVGDNGLFEGDMVDLFMETNEQCINFSARNCYVYVIGHE